MRVADVFESIFGQAQVRDYLRTTLRTGRLSHAYLFTGPPGSNKTSAAYAFAQALICPDQGCMTCDHCRRAAGYFYRYHLRGIQRRHRRRR